MKDVRYLPCQYFEVSLLEVMSILDLELPTLDED